MLHDCDIIVPTRQAIQHIVTAIQKICSNPKSSYEYIGFNPVTNNIKISTGINTIVIHVFEAKSFQCARFGPARAKPIVIDDIDECMKHMIGFDKIMACSMATYEPSEVALAHSNNIGTMFRSLI